MRVSDCRPIPTDQNDQGMQRSSGSFGTDSTVRTLEEVANVEGNERKGCCPSFTTTCQDYACVSCLFLVGAALLAAGIALCVMATVPYIVSGVILIVLGVSLLLVVIHCSFILCDDRAVKKTLATLTEAMQQKAEEFEDISETTGLAGENWKRTFEDWYKLSRIRQNVAQYGEQQKGSFSWGLRSIN